MGFETEPCGGGYIGWAIVEKEALTRLDTFGSGKGEKYIIIGLRHLHLVRQIEVVEKVCHPIAIRLEKPVHTRREMNNIGIAEQNDANAFSPPVTPAFGMKPPQKIYSMLRHRTQKSEESGIYIIVGHMSNAILLTQTVTKLIGRDLSALEELENTGLDIV